jgi:hypothetical protein
MREQANTGLAHTTVCYNHQTRLLIHNVNAKHEAPTAGPTKHLLANKAAETMHQDHLSKP